MAQHSKLHSTFFLITFILTVFMFGLTVNAGATVEQPASIDGVSTEKIRNKIKLSAAERACLEEHKTVTVRVGDWPPFMMTQNGISGISIDYLNLISSVHGIKFRYLTQKNISWPDALQSISDRNRIDMVPTIQQTAERRKYMAFTTPYQKIPWVIITRNDAEFVGSIDDLRTKTISIQNRFILQKKLEQQYPYFHLKIVNSRTPTLDSLKDVAAQKSYATINALPVAVYFIRHYGLSNLKVAAPARFDDLKLAMGVRKDWPELASIINKTIKAMTNKDVAAINNTWPSVKYEPGISKQEAKLLTLAVVGVILFICGLFIFAHRTLRRSLARHTKELRTELADRKRIEKELRVSEERYETALRAVSDGIWDWNLKTDKIYYSPRYFEMLGYHPNELPQDHGTWYNLVHLNDQERVKTVVRDYLDEFSETNRESLYSMEFRMKAKNGEWKWIFSRGRVPEVDEDGIPVRLIGTHMDITEKKKTEQLMVQTEKMMSIGGLAAGMAHEINNPLAGVLGHTQNLQNRLFKNIKKNIETAGKHGFTLEQLHSYLEDRDIPRMIQGIQESGNRAAKIVSNMICFSRQSEKSYFPCDMANLLDKAIELSTSDFNLDKLYDFKQIKIIREYDQEIPPVYCEGTEIQQVFMNLLKNGAEAMFEKKYRQVTPHFICRIKKDEQTVSVEIEDNGPGMNYETRSRIFEPFYTTKEVGKGTGLGLSVSYFIIESHHQGSISVDSAPGKWTRFTVSIPYRASGN